MTNRFKHIAASLALAASFSMAATPALARDRSWGGWGGYGRHHDRVDGGDILAGILIIGGIAAIASAASNSNKAKRQAEDRGDDYRYDNRGAGAAGDDRPSWDDSRGAETRGLDAAVERCASEIERGERRIETIETVSRAGDGWRVQGRMTGGDGFGCTVGRDGQIDTATINGAAI